MEKSYVTEHFLVQVSRNKNYTANVPSNYPNKKKKKARRIKRYVFSEYSLVYFWDSHWTGKGLSIE